MHPKREHPGPPPPLSGRARTGFTASWGGRCRAVCARQPGQAVSQDVIFQVSSAHKGVKSKAEISSAAQCLKCLETGVAVCSFCTCLVRLADC